MKLECTDPMGIRGLHYNTSDPTCLRAGAGSTFVDPANGGIALGFRSGLGCRRHHVGSHVIVRGGGYLDKFSSLWGSYQELRTAFRSAYNALSTHGSGFRCFITVRVPR